MRNVLPRTFAGLLALLGPVAASRPQPTPVGIEFQVNSTTLGSQARPAVAADSDGDFVAVWEDRPYDGAFGRFTGQRFDSAGNPQGGEFQVNTYTLGNQYRPALALDDEGDFVVAWNGPASLPPDYGGVFGQRFTGAAGSDTATLDVDGNGAIAPLADGLLVLRHMFGFTGATLVTGALAGDCMRCDAGDIDAYLDGLES